MEEKIVDVRGLSCPQPIMNFASVANELKKGKITVLVDNETAKENVIRMSKSMGWVLFDEKEDTNDGVFSLIIVKE